MDVNEPAIVIRRASGWMWFSQILLLLGTLSALSLATVMLLSDDLGASMMEDAESKNGRLLSQIPAPGPAIILLAMGIFGAYKFIGGVGLLLGAKPIVFANQGVQGVAIGAYAVGGREKALEVPRGGTVVLTSRRVTRFYGAFVKRYIVRVTTEGTYLEVETTIPEKRLDSSPLARILPMYSIRFEDRIQR